MFAGIFTRAYLTRLALYLAFVGVCMLLVFGIIPKFW